nr:MAG TPA: hypothetical protein [Caudoviricetes sp.]
MWFTYKDMILIGLCVLRKVWLLDESWIRL